MKTQKMSSKRGQFWGLRHQSRSSFAERSKRPPGMWKSGGQVGSVFAITPQTWAEQQRWYCVPVNFLLHNAFMDSHLCQIIRLTNHKPEGRLSQATHPQSCIKLKLKGANSVIHLQWMRGKWTQRKSLLLSAEKSTSVKIRGPINHLICLSHSWVDAKENTTQVEKIWPQLQASTH